MLTNVPGMQLLHGLHDGASVVLLKEPDAQPEHVWSPLGVPMLETY